MFYHNFKYTLKTLFKNKMLIFWTFIFPIVLGLFFNMAFSNIEKSETFKAIDIALVDDENTNETFKKILEEINKDEVIFNIKHVKEEEAKKLLEDDKIIGYLNFKENEPEVIIKKNDSYQTIFKNIIDEINQTIIVTNTYVESTVKNQMTNKSTNINYQEIYKNVATMLEDTKPNIKDISNNNLSYVMIEFYTLLAMTCLYGGVISMEAMNQSLPNMDSKGKRVSISPNSKKTTILSSLLASYIVQLLGVFLLFLFLLLFLKIDFGDNLLLAIILSIISSLAGLSIGVIVSVLFKTNENTKVGIIIAISMISSFFSGMMGITMKYIVDKNIPLLNKINPANMVTDGFYSLYYYDTLDRYIFNIISLLVFSSILLIISGLVLRRQKYDSI